MKPQKHIRSYWGGDFDDDEVRRKPTTRTQCPTLTGKVAKNFSYAQSHRDSTWTYQARPCLQRKWTTGSRPGRGRPAMSLCYCAPVTYTLIPCILRHKYTNFWLKYVYIIIVPNIIHESNSCTSKTKLSIHELYVYINLWPNIHESCSFTRLDAGLAVCIL